MECFNTKYPFKQMKRYSPQFIFVIIKKVLLRFFDRKGTLSEADYTKWLNDYALTFEEWGDTLDPDITKEARTFSNVLYFKSKPILASIPFDIGGHALCHVLYFIIRHFKPTTVVETGVAGGFSSESIFQANKKIMET